MAKVTERDLAKLSKASDKARSAYMRAKEKYADETIVPKIKAMVGTCLVYKGSCYSCPKKPSDYWDVYSKVVAADGPILDVVEASVDSIGVATLTRKPLATFDGTIPAGWARCAPSLFDREVRRVLKVLGITGKATP